MTKGEGGRAEEAATGEELEARLVDNGAGTVNVGNGILVSGPITRRNLGESHLVLVTFTTKGAESIVVRATWWKMRAEGERACTEGSRK